MRHASTGRTLRRSAAAMLLGIMGAGGLVLQPGVAAHAETATVPGKISVDEPDPIAEISLTPAYQQQLNSRQMGGNAVFEWAGLVSANAYPILFDLDGQALLYPSQEGDQSHGGSGTAEDPFWIETTGEVEEPGAEAGPGGTAAQLTLTQRLSYVLGTNYVRNDLTLQNTGTTSHAAQLGQLIDCEIQGSIEATSALIPATTAQCVRGPNMISLVTVSPGAALAAGYIFGVESALNQPLVGSAAADQCWQEEGGAGECGVENDAAIGAAWRVDLGVGEAHTRTSYLSYSDSFTLVDLSAETRVSATEVTVGDPVHYELSVTNGGPGTAEHTVVSFALPAGMEWVSANGDYDPERGEWVIPVLEPGTSARLEIVARADTVGEAVAEVGALVTAGIDRNPCQAQRQCLAESTRLAVTVFARPGAAEQLSGDYTVSTGERPVGGEPHTILVRLVDATATPAVGQAAQLSARTAQALGNGNVGAFSELPSEPGSYIAELSATVPGPKVVRVMLHGAELAASDNATAAFAAGPADLDRTALAAPPQLRADGTDAGTVTLDIVDEFGNPTHAVTEVELTSTAGHLSAQTLTGEGHYRATLSSSTPGVAIVSARIDGQTVPATAAVEFVPVSDLGGEPGADPVEGHGSGPGNGAASTDDRSENGSGADRNDRPDRSDPSPTAARQELPHTGAAPGQRAGGALAVLLLLGGLGLVHAGRRRNLLAAD